MIQIDYIQTADNIEEVKLKLNKNFEQLANGNGGHMGSIGFNGISGIPGLNGHVGMNGIAGLPGSGVFFYNDPAVAPYSNSVSAALADGHSIYDVWLNEADFTWWHIDASTGLFDNAFMAG
jgi:hypothetical protein